MTKAAALTAAVIGQMSGRQRPRLPPISRTVHHVRVSTNGQILLTGRLVTATAIVPGGAVLVDGDRIAFAGKASELPARWRHTRPPEGWTGNDTLLPGLVDAHCHGGAGGEFGADPASADLAAGYHHRAGTTTLVGSLVYAVALALSLPA